MVFIEQIAPQAYQTRQYDHRKFSLNVAVAG
jgi:hypothetical protein